MLRIGLLGSDNSHADRFAEILNRPDHPAYLPDADARIVAIWGQEAERTRQVAATNAIPTIVAHPAQLAGQVDAVICVTRHGGLHRELVVPYLTAGVPTFIDKPLAVAPEDARAIVAAAQAAGTPFSSFSTVRYAASMQEFARAAAAVDVRVGVYSGPATRRNPYGGVIFDAIHSIEMMLMLQGTGVRAVSALEGPPVDEQGNGNLSATCTYADGALGMLSLTVDAQYGFTATVLGRAGVAHRALDISDCYRAGMKRVLACLRGDTTSPARPDVTPAAMIEAVQIATAMERSLDSGRAVTLEEV